MVAIIIYNFKLPGYMSCNLFSSLSIHHLFINFLFFILLWKCWSNLHLVAIFWGGWGEIYDSLLQLYLR